MGEIKNINHVAIVVSDLDAAVKFWSDGLGIPLSHIEDVPSQSAKVAFLPVGSSEIELVFPTDENCGTAKFLKERGAGMHHLCIEVDCLEDVMADLKAKGIRLTSDTPAILEGRKVVFIHPKSALGVLVELYQPIDV
ncbi:MAG TPA: methylmalonyl-CoA epimerase [Anaerolineaceae bacterium]